VRTVAGRIEWRLPDPSCNVYAAIAAALAAGLDGIESNLPSEPACDEDLYQRHARAEPMPARLPRDLHSALDALESDTTLVSALGDAFCTNFLQLKREEWNAWSQQVTLWELERYANRL
jgi:glutamine synthetase